MDQTLKLHPSKSVVILGCGDLGKAIARELNRFDIPVIGIKRSVPDKTEDAGHYPLFQYKKGDIRDIRSIAPFLNEQISDIIFCPTPDKSTEEDYRETYFTPLKHLCELLNQKQLSPKVSFISSTSVYGQQQGEIVDEESSTSPTGFNGIWLLRCEELIRQSNLPHFIFRLSGIYGAHRRRLLNQLIEKNFSVPNQLTNRVHIEDAARAIGFLLTASHVNDSLYCITDCEPATKLAIAQWLHANNSLEITKSDSHQIPTGKAISNTRLQKTGFTFTYPNFKEGYAAILNIRNQ